MIICRTELGNYIVVDKEYAGGTYYDADTYQEALSWAKTHNLDIDEDDFRDYYVGR